MGNIDGTSLEHLLREYQYEEETAAIDEDSA